MANNLDALEQMIDTPSANNSSPMRVGPTIERANLMNQQPRTFDAGQYSPNQLRDLNFLEQEVDTLQAPIVQQPKFTQYIKPKEEFKGVEMDTFGSLKPSELIYAMKQKKKSGAKDEFATFRDEMIAKYDNDVMTFFDKMTEEEKQRFYDLRTQSGPFTDNKAFNTYVQTIGSALSGFQGFTEGVQNLVSSIGGKVGGDEQGAVEEITSRSDLGQKQRELVYQGQSLYGETPEEVQDNLILKIVEGISRMAPSLALGAVTGGALGLPSLVASASGSGIDEALSRGANFDNAIMYGTITGALEGIIEKAFGGIPGFGEGFISKLFKQKGGSKLLSFLFDSLGEGLEEVVATTLSPMVNNLTTRQKQELASDDELLESFVLGSLISGVLQGGAALGSATQTQQTQETEQDELFQATQGMIDGQQDELFTATQELLNQQETPTVEGDDPFINTTTTETVTEDIIPTERNITFTNEVNDNLINDFIDRVNYALPQDAQIKVVTTKLQPNDLGFYQNGVITLNEDSQEPLIDVLKHELTHHIEKSDLYQDFADFVLTQYDVEGTLESKRNELKDKYRQVYKDKASPNSKPIDEGTLDQIVEGELVAFFVQDNLFKSQDSVEKLTQVNPSLARRIMTWIKEKLQYLTSKKNLTKEERNYQKFLKRAENLYSQALSGEFIQSRNAVRQYALSEDVVNTLEQENKQTLPKIMVEKVFVNPREVLSSEQTQGIDKVIESGEIETLPTEGVDVNNIIPTQRSISINNLQTIDDVTNIPIEDSILLNKIGDKYYVIDGHHRISNAILSGETTVDAKVYDDSKQEQTTQFAIEREGAAPIVEGQEGQMQLDFPNRDLGDGKKVSKFLQTTFESDIGQGALGQEILDEIAKGKGTYRVVGDRETINDARRDIERSGYNNNVAELYTKFERGDRFNKYDVVRGQLLIEDAINRGDMDTARELLFDLAIVGTELGQSIQALHLIKKATPQGKGIQIQKIVNRLNNSDKMKKFNKKLTEKGKSPVEIELPQEMMDSILNAEDQETLDKAFNEALLYVNQQVPLSFGDKTRSWRYLAMLGNPRTHIRNIVGNTAMRQAAKVRRGVSGAIEDLVDPAVRQRTLKQATPEVKNFAIEDAEVMKPAITGSEKFNFQEGRRSFDNDFFEKVAQLNFGALETMDWKFARKAYIESLANYLTANGYTTEWINSGSKQAKIELNKAREFAINEAKEQTFRTYSQIANRITQLENSNELAKFFIGGVLPFKTTPINIAKMGFEYGPINFAKVLWKASNNEYNNTSDMINDISKGLTGTGVLLLGKALAEMGILNAGGSDEDREKYFQQGIGKQPYSINLGDKTYTLDWAAPVAIPLFIGAELGTEKGESDLSVQNILDSLSTTLDPLTEMSMLQGLNRTLSGYSDNKLAGLGVNVVQNYFGQYVPTLAGQIARTVDDTRRTTYAPSDSPITKTGEQFLRKTLSKIPGVSQFMEPYLDQFGREQKEENILVRAFQNFLSPGYVKDIEKSPVTEELQRLYDLTNESGVLPGNRKRDLTVDGEKITFDSKQYTEYNKDRGQYALELLEETITMPQYQNLTDEQKVEAIESIYDYANDKAKAKFLGEEFESSNLSPGMEMIYESSIKSISGDKDENGDTIPGSTQGKKAFEIMQMDISSEDKNEMLSMITTSDTPENIENLDFLQTQEDYVSYFSSSPSTRSKIRAASEIGIEPTTYTTTKSELKDVKANTYTNALGEKQSYSGDKKDKIYAYLYATYPDKEQLNYMFEEVYGYTPYKENQLSDNPYYYWINENKKQLGRELSQEEIKKIIDSNMGYRK